MQQARKKSLSIQDRCVVVNDEVNRRQFKYDHCFDSSGLDSRPAARQEDVFNALGNRVLTHAWQGFNSTVLAYGQTGSGKVCGIRTDCFSEPFLLWRVTERAWLPAADVHHDGRRGRRRGPGAPHRAVPAEWRGQGAEGGRRQWGRQVQPQGQLHRGLQ
jgi:hypothetical protein